MAFRNPIINNFTLPTTAGSSDPREVYGVSPTPPELVTYYLTAPLAFTAPETVVTLNQYFDGKGNYTYEALVVDSSVPKMATSRVIGAYVNGVVNEFQRTPVNPNSVLGGGLFEYILASATLILHTAPNTDPAQTVAGTRIPGDTVHRWSLAANGTQGWGPGGSTLTDAYLARTDVGDMELAEFLRIRNFTGLTQNALECRLDGEANGRLFIHVDGTHRWSDGTNPSDTGLFRRSGNELSVDGDFSLSTLGDGLLIKEGANGAQGIVTLVAGTATVNVNWIAANSRIFLTCQVPGGTPGFLRVSSRVVGTSFTITSSSAADTSQVAYLIMSPA